MAELEPPTEAPRGEPPAAPDAAQRSLSDALRISFALLRLLMLVLLAVFLLSGMFKVKTGEVAVRLQLGRLVEADKSDTFYTPGGPYFAWPEPIDTIIRVPVTPQKLILSRPFWFKVEDQDTSKRLDELPVTKDLDPDQDGFLVTGDQNIMHGRWEIEWQVTEREAADFIRTVSARSTPREMARDAEEIIRRIAEQAIVATTAEHTADQFNLGTIPWDVEAKNRMQATLRRMESGIQINRVTLIEQTPPLGVRAAFLLVDQAQSTSNQAITSAQTDRARILGEAAGDASAIIVPAVEYYERLLRRGESARAAQLEKALGRFYAGDPADACFAELAESEKDPVAKTQLAAWLQHVRISGKAYDTVEKARGTAATSIQAVRKEAEVFENRLKQYRDNPRVVRDRLWQETMNELFAGDAERFYLPPGNKEIYLDMSRDPAIKKRKEQEAYEKEQERKRDKK